MNIDPEQILKFFGGAGAFGAAFGAAFRFVAPFAQRTFDSWLTRTERREALRLAREEAEQKKDLAREESLLKKERAIVDLAVLQERITGILEDIAERLGNIEAHHGIRPRPALVSGASEEPRATITGQNPVSIPEPHVPPKM